MTTDLDRKAREQFNAWLLSRGVVITDLHRRLDMFDAWKAALRLAVPDGYVVVPREATQEMLQMIAASLDYPSVYMGGPSELSKRRALRAYRAMIAAAPTLADEVAKS